MERDRAVPRCRFAGKGPWGGGPLHSRSGGPGTARGARPMGPPRAAARLTYTSSRAVPRDGGTGTGDPRRAGPKRHSRFGPYAPAETWEENPDPRRSP